MKVSWDDDIPNWMEKIDVPNHQNMYWVNQLLYFYGHFP